MTKPQFSLFVFGLYMIFCVGLGFMLVPSLVLGLFGLSAGDDAWIRFVGMLASILGIYYVLAARAKLDRFIPWTVGVRVYAAAFMVVMVLLGKIGAPVLLFALVDSLAAAWTFAALRSDRENVTGA